MKMINCEKVMASIYVYLDNESSADDISEIKLHLDLCRECFKRLDFERLLRKHMRAKTSHACPERLKKRIERLLEIF